MGARLTSFEYYLPEQTLDNAQLSQDFPDWDVGQFEKKIGIRQRHIAGAEQTSVDLACAAAEKVFRHYDREKIDFVLLCTQSPDYFLPSSSCIVQARLGLRTDIGALDMNLGCSGYVYGLAICKGLIAAGIARSILFIVAETYSKFIHPRDRANRTIFGDAAAATIVEYDEREHIRGLSLGTDGSGANNLIVMNGGARRQFDPQAPLTEEPPGSLRTQNNLYMDGPEIFNFTIDVIPALVAEVLARAKLTLQDVDQVICHQANKYILGYLRKKMDIPESRFWIDMEDTGNTVSASIPIALKQCLDRGVLSPGKQAMLVGFGVGYSWGGTVVTL